MEEKKIWREEKKKGRKRNDVPQYLGDGRGFRRFLQLLAGYDGGGFRAEGGGQLFPGDRRNFPHGFRRIIARAYRRRRPPRRDTVVTVLWVQVGRSMVKHQR